MDKESLQFNDVKFKIKEFESVDIMQGYFLAFYAPKERHLKARKTNEI